MDLLNEITIPNEIQTHIDSQDEKPKRITTDYLKSPEMTFIEEGEQIMLDGVKIFLHPLFPEFGCTYSGGVVDTESGKEAETIFINDVKNVILKLQDSIVYYILTKFIFESFYNSYINIERHFGIILPNPEFKNYGFNVNNSKIVDIKSKKEVETIDIDGIKCVFLKYDDWYIYKVYLCFVVQCFDDRFYVL